MSETWYAAFGLLAVLCITNTLVLVGLLRQVGVLHQRVRPIGPGAIDGPGPGTILPQLDLSAVTQTNGQTPFSSPITLIGYVKPGCGVCESLPSFFRAYLKTAPSGLGVTALLATDAGASESAAMANHLSLAEDLPLFRNPQLGAAYQIPGSPYVLALRKENDRESKVLAAGVVNELEQLEILIDEAMEFRDGHPDAAGGDPRVTLSGPSAFEVRVAPTSSPSGDPDHVSGPHPAAELDKSLIERSIK